MFKFIFPCVLIFFAIFASAEETRLPEKFYYFFDWVKEQGAVFPKIELKQMSANMRGMYALEDIKVCMPEAGVRDLINIFNSAVKTHRDLMSDVIAIQDRESKEEKALATEYTGKVDELLKKITDKK